MGLFAALVGAQDRVLYRVLASQRPTRRDFQSDAALGREPRLDQLKDRRQYEGISMFDHIGDAAKVARRFKLGPAIAELHISTAHPDVAIHKTRGPHH